MPHLDATLAIPRITHVDAQTGGAETIPPGAVVAIDTAKSTLETLTTILLTEEFLGVYKEQAASGVTGAFELERYAPGALERFRREPVYESYIPDIADGVPLHLRLTPAALETVRAALRAYDTECAHTPDIILDAIRTVLPRMDNAYKAQIETLLAAAHIDTHDAWSMTDEQLLDALCAQVQTPDGVAMRNAPPAAHAYATLRGYYMAPYIGAFVAELSVLQGDKWAIAHQIITDFEAARLGGAHQDTIPPVSTTGELMPPATRNAPHTAMINTPNRAISGADGKRHNALLQAGAIEFNDGSPKRPLYTVVRLLDACQNPIGTTDLGEQIRYGCAPVFPQAEVVLGAVVDMLDYTLVSTGRAIDIRTVEGMVQTIAQAGIYDIPINQLGRRIFSTKSVTQAQLGDIRGALAIMRGINTVIEANALLDKKDRPWPKIFEGALLNTSIIWRPDQYGNVVETVRVHELPPLYLYSLASKRIARIDTDFTAVPNITRQTMQILALRDYLMQRIVTCERTNRGWAIPFADILAYLHIAPTDKGAKRERDAIRNQTMRMLDAWIQTGFISDYTYTGGRGKTMIATQFIVHGNPDRIRRKPRRKKQQICTKERG